ncbi:MAG TPA: hypothetical protein VEY07_06735, partial [Thermoplasmata archaeon]|nr:hypothetical protein [Thermoplasmata archaeon]
LGAGEVGSVSGSMESDLGAVAAGVVARGYLLDQARGITEPLLGEDSILRGIRAMDAEVLDRPSVGEVL